MGRTTAAMWWQVCCWLAVHVEAGIDRRAVFTGHDDGHAVMVLACHGPSQTKVTIFTSLSEAIGDGVVAEFDLTDIYVQGEQ